MRFKSFFENALQKPQSITVTYKSVDGVLKAETYTGPDAEERAKKFIDEWVGLNGEVGENANYIVADDGVGIVAVKGINILDLLGREKPAKEPSEGYAVSLGRTALLMNFPALLERCFDNDIFQQSKGSFIFDFETGKIDNIWRQKEHGRFAFHSTFDKYDGEVWISLAIFTYFGGSMQQNRYDKVFHFKPTDRDTDLAKVEKFLQEHQAMIKNVENIAIEKGGNLLK